MKMAPADAASDLKVLIQSRHPLSRIETSFSTSCTKPSTRSKRNAI
jgi:hypothetical protein